MGVEQAQPVDVLLRELEVTRSWLQAVLVELPDLISLEQRDGTEVVSGSSLRYLRAVHRWRCRGLSWSEVRQRFGAARESGLNPVPAEILWVEPEATAWSAVEPAVARESERPGLDPDAVAVIKGAISELSRDLARHHRARRQDVDQLATEIRRLEAELQLLRNEIAGTLQRRDRKRR